MVAQHSTELLRFQFGQNWKRYLDGINENHIENAVSCLRALVGDLRGKSFLDVGCGSGIQSLAALRLGASRILAFDYDSDCVNCTASLKQKFAPSPNWSIEHGSVLDESYMRSLGQFDVVYSWGALHHTSDMWRALDLVTIPIGDCLVISIYNDAGLESRIWRHLKKYYVGSGRIVRKCLEAACFLRCWGVPFIKSPRSTVNKWRGYSRNRGMSAWSDIADWAGGYPYQVATPAAIREFFSARGFTVVTENLDPGMGCNEFVLAPCPVHRH